MTTASDELYRFVAQIPQTCQFPLRADRPLLLLGAGQNGAILLEKLTRAGFEIAGFIDDNSEKQQRGHLGKQVWSAQNALKEWGSEVQVLVTIYKNGHRYLVTKNRFNNLGFKNVFSIAEVIVNYPIPDESFYSYCTKSYLLDHLERLTAVYANLTDHISREWFKKILQFKLTGDFSCLQGESDTNFIFRVLETKPDLHYIDGGSFDGDTIAQFVDRRGEGFTSIVGFEPDPDNYAKLTNYIDSLPTSLKSKISIRQVALGKESGELNFEPFLGASSKISGTGSIVVPSETLDKFAGDNFYIKLDLEGGEQLALEGARRMIREYSPILGISVYHKPDDLWTLPELVLRENPNYHFALRMLADELIDTMLYAFPQN